MEECIICFNETPPAHFVVFLCTHKVCVHCYPRLRVPLCPICSRRITFPVEQPPTNRLWCGGAIIGVLITVLILNYRNIIF